MKGGDFMAKEQDNPVRDSAIEDAISRMIWEGSPVLTINPDLAKVEVGSNPTTHPLRKGRIASEATSGIVEKPRQQAKP